jgi:antitoxin component YwqK of YwqJK toxin-antitoxin module
MLAVTLLTSACKGASDAIPSCPQGATLMGAAPPRGQEVWCQKIVDGEPVKEGVFIVYANGGGKMIEGAYRDGRQDGEWTMWFDNGRRAAVDHYRAGVQDGTHISWYASGVKALEGNYRDGKRVGVWTRWDPTGLNSHKQNYQAGSSAD